MKHIKYFLVLLVSLLSACRNDYTPRQAVMAKEYCKANGMEYVVEVVVSTGKYGNSESAYHRCKDTDGSKYRIPDNAVVDNEQ